MSQTLTISLPGSVLSYLLYEVNKTSFQYGFFLGEIVHNEVISITDRDEKQVDVSKIVKINSVIPWPNSSDFAKGRVNKEKIQTYLGSNINKVVAWYIYRAYTFEYSTIRNRVLYKQFQELFDVPPDLFSCCIVTRECSKDLDSYTLSQKFMRILNGQFDNLKMSIPNLGETTNTYISSEPPSDVFNKIVSDIKSVIENTNSVLAIKEIENAIEEFNINTINELADAELTLFRLQRDIKKLQLKKS